MTNLNRLKVSLTKHGAHKITQLIKAFPTDQVLKNTINQQYGISIDKAQSSKNLSANNDDTLPAIWDEAKRLGDQYVDDLVILAILFSHHELIQIMINRSTGKMKGTAYREDFANEKSYTNFANNFDELGFATYHSVSRVSYDLSRILMKFELVPLIIQLLTFKLKAAGWDGNNDFLDECIVLNFHKAFGLSEAEFRQWLQEGYVDKLEEQEEFIEEEPEVNDFNFKSGHLERSEAQVVVRKAKGRLKSTLLHNKIQNKMYEYLVKNNGPDAVGTEVDCGIGKPVDVVLNDHGHFIFYEIKTDKSVRLCIRQALSQLLEYSCWPNEKRAEKLIIVSPNKITNQADKYIKHLRDIFDIPIYYQQFDLEAEELTDFY